MRGRTFSWVLGLTGLLFALIIPVSAQTVIHENGFGEVTPNFDNSGGNYLGGVSDAIYQPSFISPYFKGLGNRTILLQGPLESIYTLPYDGYTVGMWNNPTFISSLSSGYNTSSYSATTENSTFNVNSLEMLVGNYLSGTSNFPAQVSLVNDGDRAYTVLYQNYAENAQITNRNQGRTFITGNTVEGVVISNENKALMLVDRNYAHGAVIDNSGDSTMDIIGNNLSEGTITNAGGGANDTSEMWIVHNLADHAVLFNKNKGFMYIYGSEGDGLEITNDAEALLFIDACTASYGCTEDRPNYLAKGQLTNYGEAAVVGENRLEEFTVDNHGYLYLRDNLYFSDSLVNNDNELFVVDARISGGSINNLQGANLSFNSSSTLENNHVLNNSGKVVVDSLEVISSALNTSNTGTFTINNSLALTSSQFSSKGLIEGNGDIRALSSTLAINSNANPYAGTISLQHSELDVHAGELSAATVLVGEQSKVIGYGALGHVQLDKTASLIPGHAFQSTSGIMRIAGDLHSNGGSIVLNSALGGDASPTEQLFVQGKASGTAGVKVMNRLGQGAQTSSGIKLISVGGDSAGVFTLLGDYEHEGSQSIVAGAYAYKLHHNTGDGHWYLHSTFLNTDKPDPEKPRYQAGVASYESYASSLLFSSQLPTLQQRTSSRKWANGVSDRSTDAQTQAGVWGKVDGAYARHRPRSSTSDAQFTQTTYQLELGVDSLLSRTETGDWVGGVSAHYGHSKANTVSHHGDGRIKTDSYGLGLSATWLGQNNWYLDGQAQLSWHDSDLFSKLAQANLVKGNGARTYAVSVELGHHWRLASGWQLSPQAQLSYSKAKFDAFTDRYGARVDLQQGERTLARLGLAVRPAGFTPSSPIDAYGLLSLYYDFTPQTKTRVQTVSFVQKQERLWMGAGVGGAYSWNKNLYSIYAEGMYTSSLQHMGDAYSVSGMLGLRLRW